MIVPCAAGRTRARNSEKEGLDPVKIIGAEFKATNAIPTWSRAEEQHGRLTTAAPKRLQDAPAVESDGSITSSTMRSIAIEREVELHRGHLLRGRRRNPVSVSPGADSRWSSLHLRRSAFHCFVLRACVARAILPPGCQDNPWLTEMYLGQADDRQAARFCVVQRFRTATEPANQWGDRS